VVYRYHWDDGLPGREGGFHICTSWLIEAYLRTGRRSDAEELFTQMVDTAGPTGLTSVFPQPVPAAGAAGAAAVCVPGCARRRLWSCSARPEP
ncbi:hypothetical protein MTQ10_13345, partial [Streptomyces sp. XM83C]|nr:hypothetical protein [Streptomyces sp. XM83C]